MMVPHEPTSGSRLGTVIAATFYAAGAVVGIACGLAEVYIHMLQALVHATGLRDGGYSAMSKKRLTADAAGLCEQHPPPQLQKQRTREDGLSTPSCPPAAPVEADSNGGSPAPPATPTRPKVSGSSTPAATTAAVAAPLPAHPEFPAAEASWASDEATATVSMYGGTYISGEGEISGIPTSPPSPPAEVEMGGGEVLVEPESVTVALASPSGFTPTAAAGAADGLGSAVHADPAADVIAAEDGVSAVVEPVAREGGCADLYGSPVAPAAAAGVLPVPPAAPAVSEQAAVDDPQPRVARAVTPDFEEARSESGESGITAASYGTASSLDPTTGAPTSRRLKAANAAAAGAAAAAPAVGLSYAHRLEEKRAHGRRKGAHKASTR